MGITMTRVPAGWYPDPLDDAATTRRWWDGETWTEYTAPLSYGSGSSASSSPSIGGSTSVSALSSTGAVAAGVALAPTSHDSALIAHAMTLHPGSPATSPPDSRPSVSCASSASSPAALTPASPPATRIHTPAVWVMTAMPAVQVLLYVAMATRYPVEAPPWTIALAVLLPFLCYAGLAGVDARLLGEDGHLRVAPWGLAVVAPPLYLAARAARPRGGSPAHRFRRSAWSPLAIWAAVQAAVLGCWFLLAPASIAAVVALIV